MYRSAFIAASLLPLTACMDVGSIDEEVRLEQHVLDVVAASRYRESGFVRVNAQPYPTALDDTNTINVWVDEASAAAFARVTPETTGSRVELAPGAAIVREVVTPGGDLSALTVMMRGSDGYFTEGGDYCYAVTTPDGSAFVDDRHGRVSVCADCHAERASDGFLFGVPIAQR